MSSRTRNRERVCACCGTTFLSSRNDARFCSEKCTADAYAQKQRMKKQPSGAKQPIVSSTARVGQTPPKRPKHSPRTRSYEFSCEICGTAFTSCRNDARFCSRKCTNIHNRQKAKIKAGQDCPQNWKPSGRRQAICAWCHQPFIAAREDTRLCSKECTVAERTHKRRLQRQEEGQVDQRFGKRERNFTLTCNHCSQPFTASRADAKFCSTACTSANYAQVVHLRKMAKLDESQVTQRKSESRPKPRPQARITEPRPLLADKEIVDLRALCYLTTISRSAMYRLLKDPHFPILKINGSLRFPKVQAIAYLIEKYGASILTNENGQQRKRKL